MRSATTFPVRLSPVSLRVLRVLLRLWCPRGRRVPWLLTVCAWLDAVSVQTAGTNVVSGHTAYTLLVKPRLGTHYATGPRNVYAIYGSEDATLTLPPAYHVPAPFGADFGGTNPAFWQINAASQWDSWLTVGITEGDSHNLISSIGIDWTTWTAEDGISVDDGAVFWVSVCLECDARRPRLYCRAHPPLNCLIVVHTDGSR